jgi:molybdopterin-containing oxidoreductase family membrane subunit
MSRIRIPASITRGGHTVPLRPRAAAHAAIDEWSAMPGRLRLWLAALAAVIAAGAVAAVIAVPPGWEVMGTTPDFEWGLLIAGYVFFAIITSGLCLSSALGTVLGIDRFRPLERRHVILAVLSLCAAFLIIALDLHYPVRMILGAVLSPSPSSPMWWMGVFYGCYLVVLLVETASMFLNREVLHQWSCTAAAVLAIAAPTTLGAVFGSVTAKGGWGGAWTLPTMTASALAAGAALLAVVFALVARYGLSGAPRVRTHAVPALRGLLLFALALTGALTARVILAGTAADAPLDVSLATAALVSGPLAIPFWGIRVAAGLAAPAVLLVLLRSPRSLGVAGALALLGVAADRMLLVLDGSIAPVTATAGTAPFPYAWYMPSLVEVLIVAMAAALVALVYTLVERYVDLGDTDAHHAGYGIGLAKARLAAHLAGRRAAAAAGAAATAGVRADA